jgi:vacuolar-type H+-ATPase subunit C/Vma6
MVDLLGETVYRDLKNALAIYERYGNPLVIEAQETRICYELIWRSLRGIADQTAVRELIGTEIDLKNLQYILSFKYMHMEEELLEKLIIDIKYKLPKDLAQQLAGISYQNVPEHLTWPRYREIARKAVELMSKGKLSDTENLFLQQLYSYAETIAVRNPNNLVYVFTYLELCFREARNLTSLIVGKQLRMEDEKIRSLLLL